MEEGNNAFKIVRGKLTGKEGCPGIDGRTIFEWILNKYVSIKLIVLIRHRMWIIEEPL